MSKSIFDSDDPREVARIASDVEIQRIAVLTDLRDFHLKHRAEVCAVTQSLARRLAAKYLWEVARPSVRRLERLEDALEAYKAWEDSAERARLSSEGNENDNSGVSEARQRLRSACWAAGTEPDLGTILEDLELAREGRSRAPAFPWDRSIVIQREFSLLRTLEERKLLALGRRRTRCIEVTAYVREALSDDAEDAVLSNALSGLTSAHLTRFIATAGFVYGLPLRANMSLIPAPEVSSLPPWWTGREAEVDAVSAGRRTEVDRWLGELGRLALDLLADPSGASGALSVASTSAVQTAPPRKDAIAQCSGDADSTGARPGTVATPESEVAIRGRLAKEPAERVLKAYRVIEKVNSDIVGSEHLRAADIPRNTLRDGLRAFGFKDAVVSPVGAKLALRKIDVLTFLRERWTPRSRPGSADLREP